MSCLQIIYFRGAVNSSDPGLGSSSFCKSVQGAVGSASYASEQACVSEVSAGSLFVGGAHVCYRLRDAVNSMHACAAGGSSQFGGTSVARVVHTGCDMSATKLGMIMFLQDSFLLHLRILMVGTQTIPRVAAVLTGLFLRELEATQVATVVRFRNLRVIDYRFNQRRMFGKCSGICKSGTNLDMHKRCVLFATGLVARAGVPPSAGAQQLFGSGMLCTFDIRLFAFLRHADTFFGFTHNQSALSEAVTDVSGADRLATPS